MTDQTVRGRLSALFDRKLNAPMEDPLNSWGAVGRMGNRVVLRVWQDERSGRDFLVLSDKYGDCPEANERRRHVDLIEYGNRSFILVVCKRLYNTRREVTSFDDVHVFTGKRLRRNPENGDVFAVFDRGESLR